MLLVVKGQLQAVVPAIGTGTAETSNADTRLPALIAFASAEANYTAVHKLALPPTQVTNLQAHPVSSWGIRAGLMAL